MNTNSKPRLDTFTETLSTTKVAYYWDPGEALASYDTPVARNFGRGDNRVEYQFDDFHVFYLRIIPVRPCLHFCLSFD